MGKMKDEYIKLMNITKTPLQDYSDLSIEDVQCKLHEDYISLVNESGYPLWVYETYRDNVMLQHYREAEGIDNSSPSANNWTDSLNTAELEDLLQLENFKASGKGQDYRALFGNWEDAYDQYLYDLGYYTSLDPQ